MALDRRVDRLEQLMERIEAAVARLAEAQVRAEERLARVEERLDRVEERVGRLEAAVAHLAEAQARTEERLARLEDAVARLAEAQARTEERLARLEDAVARLAEAQARTDERLARLAETQVRTEARLARTDARLAGLRGNDLERRYAENAPAYFQRLLRQLRLVPKEELGRLAEGAEDRGVLSASERELLLWTDVVAFGRWRDTGDETYLAVEVSATVDTEDIERAADRARLLQRVTGLRAVAAAAGEDITPEAERQAARLGVWRVLNGRTYAPNEAPPGKSA
ncbi:MAG: hypothetical protein QN183_15280 [Armatimonadota bacterium]|nr:hypothetical protein [Armatimonadota bacterium]MDR7545006.1 hypothetical protein [Armatimonadota bacterium]